MLHTVMDQRGHCQWVCRLFLSAVLLLGLLGCGRKPVPPLDTVPSQLLRDACEALVAGDTRRSRDLLQRLADTPEGEAVATVALERLEQHAALAEINQLLRAGRLDDANRLVREATGPASKAAAQAEPLIEALLRLQAYLGQRPFTTSEAAEGALQSLEPARAELAASPAFIAFLDAETVALDALRRREDDQVVASLIGELDEAAVSGRPAASPRLAHLAALRPQHLLLRTLAAGTDARALAALARESAVDEAARRAFEVGLCLAWPGLSESAWRGLVPVLRQGTPAGHAGLLLQAAACAEGGDYETAVRHLHALAEVPSVDAGHVERLLSRYVVAPRQTQAWCWQTPSPGVAEILSSIIQLRTSRPR